MKSLKNKCKRSGYCFGSFSLGLGSSKRSQITILVIIALIIITSIIFIFLLIRKPEVSITPEENPQAYMQKCMADSLQRAEKIALEGNGYRNLTSNYILYMGKKTPFLCKASQFYIPCVNQEPMYSENVKKIFEEEAKKDSDKCFSEMMEGYKSKGYSVNLDNNRSLSIVYMEDRVSVDLRGGFSALIGEESRRYDYFYADIKSPIYVLANTARQIANFESLYCEFDNMGWMKYYRNIDVSRFVTGDGTKIYTITERASNKSISIAIRGCVMPAGI